MNEQYFDKYPEVYEKDLENAQPQERKKIRLNKRYKYIIEPIKDQLKDKHVLTLGGLTGRWPLAILDAGAAHVTTIEFKHFISLEDNLEKYFGGQDRYTVLADDFYLAMPKISKKIDIIFNLGVYYHVCNHELLMKECLRFEPELMVLDSMFSKRNALCVDFHMAGYGLEGKASVSLTNKFANKYGYELKELVWDKKDCSVPALVEYRKKLRRTFHVVSKK
jgi:hypothetical protein